jgi:hypothetical protein
MNSLPDTSLKKRTVAPTIGLTLLVVALVLLGLTVANYRFAAASPGGNDFIPRWLGTRLLLTEGQNPYSDETSLAIQRFIYGRPAAAGEDSTLFVYPLYSALIFAPFAMIGDYVLARAVWMTVLELALLAMAAIALRLADWRPSLPVLALTFLFVLIWYHSVRPLINGNPSVLMATFVAAALLAIKTKHDVLGGVLLAFSTIKPQAVVLIIPLILVWSLFQKRYLLLASTIVTFAALVALALLVEPAWLSQNLKQVTAYPDYTEAGTPGDIFEQWWPGIGRWLGILLTLIIVVALLWYWRISASSSFELLLPVVFFTLAATNMVGITTAVSNYIALFPGLILVLAHLRIGQGRLSDWPAALILISLIVALWLLFWYSRTGSAQSPIMFFPLPLLLMIAMPAIVWARRKSQRRDSPSGLLSS